MRRSCVLALVCLLPIAGGCDSSQPAQVGQRTLAIDFAANNLAVQTYNVWDLTQDVDGDGQPDNNFLVCELDTDNNGVPLTTIVSGPWQYSVQIGVIRAGETTETQLSSTAAASSVTANLTPYDTISGRGRTCPRFPPVPCPDPSGEFVYTNPQRISSANPLLVNVTDPQNPPRVNCPTADLGDPAVDGRLPFLVTVNRGDTVVVRARKAEDPALGFSGVLSNPSLAGRVVLDGQQVTPIGTIASTADLGAGITFSYTVR